MGIDHHQSSIISTTALLPIQPNSFHLLIMVNHPRREVRAVPLASYRTDHRKGTEARAKDADIPRSGVVTRRSSVTFGELETNGGIRNGSKETVWTERNLEFGPKIKMRTIEFLRGENARGTFEIESERESASERERGRETFDTAERDNDRKRALTWRTWDQFEGPKHSERTQHPKI